jgi:DNA-binding transcriptional ArsR family regulator
VGSTLRKSRPQHKRPPSRHRSDFESGDVLVGMSVTVRFKEVVQPALPFLAYREQAVYQHLHSILNSEHGDDWHSKATLAKQLGKSKSSVSEALSKLVELGLIRREQRGSHDVVTCMLLPTEEFQGSVGADAIDQGSVGADATTVEPRGPSEPLRGPSERPRGPQVRTLTRNRTRSRTRKPQTPSHSDSAGGIKSSDRQDGGNTSSRPRKRSRSNDSATKQTHTSAAAAGPRHPRARARRGKQTAHVDLHGNVSHRLSDDEVERRFAHTGPEQLPLELDHEHGFRFDRHGVLVAWPAWYDGEARLNLHIGSAALRPENGYQKREAERAVKRGTAA